jgi:lipoprotein-releasing system ATP-binding protein
MIVAKNIFKSYQNQAVLSDCNFLGSNSKLIAILGASGSGKSTFLNILGGIEQPDQGSISINGKVYGSLKDKEKARIRNKQIGFVFQEHRLLPELSALENVLLPVRIANESISEAKKRAKGFFEILGVDGLENKMPAELSGGEKQRFAVARALINEADTILADEPSGALDNKNAENLLELFLSVRDKLSKTIIFVTHNETLAAKSDEIWRMNDGQLSREN